MINGDTMFNDPHRRRPRTRPEAIWAPSRKATRLKEQQAEVFRTVMDHPGLTTPELAIAHPFLDQSQFSRRLPELVTLGVIRRGKKRKPKGHGNCATWFPITAADIEG